MKYYRVGVFPGTDLHLASRCDPGTSPHPVSEKTQDWDRRTSGRCAVASEKGRTPTMGGVIFLIACSGYFSVL